MKRKKNNYQSNHKLYLINRFKMIIVYKIVLSKKKLKISPNSQTKILEMKNKTEQTLSTFDEKVLAEKQTQDALITERTGKLK